MSRRILIILFIGVMFSGFVMANDWSVFQGQYFIGDKFKVGTFEFDFNVYDNESGGDLIYSHSENLMTGTWGQWIIEIEGVSRAANNISKDYFMEIVIEGVPQLPRRRITQFNFLREVDGITGESLDSYYNKTEVDKRISSVSTGNIWDLIVLKPSISPNNPESGTIYLDVDGSELRFYDGVDWFSIEVRKLKKPSRVATESFSEAGVEKSEGESVLEEEPVEEVVEEETVEGETTTTDESAVEEEIVTEVCEEVCTSEEVCEDVESCDEECSTDEEGVEICNEVCSTEEVCEDVESCEEVCVKPEQLFDIAFNLEESTISGSEDLSGVITFESFGSVPTPIDMEIFVVDGDGEEVYYDNIRIVVVTENVIRWNYNGVELGEGDYDVILKTVYNVDVTDEFRKKVEVRPGFWKRITDWFWGFYNKPNRR